MSTNPYADVLRRDLFHEPKRARGIYPAKKAPKRDRAVRLDSVLDLLAEGKDNIEIAEALGLQVSTVQKYIWEGYRRAGISGKKRSPMRVQLVLWHLKRTGRLA